MGGGEGDLLMVGLSERTPSFRKVTKYLTFQPTPPLSLPTKWQEMGLPGCIRAACIQPLNRNITSQKGPHQARGNKTKILWVCACGEGRWLSNGRSIYQRSVTIGWRKKSGFSNSPAGRWQETALHDRNVFELHVAKQSIKNRNIREFPAAKLLTKSGSQSSK